MAGDWIPMKCDLQEDPAVILIAATLGIDEFAVVGRLHRLWSWANKHTTTGNAHGVTSEWVDRYLSTPGFATAMHSAGWLRLRSGGIDFPNFDRWNSQNAKQRALTARRVANHKLKRVTDGNAKGNAPGVSDALPTEQKRTKQKKVPSEPTSADKPPPKEKPRNPLFDAVAEVTGYDPATAGGLLGSVAAALAKADPPYTPEDVREFARQFVVLCPYAARDGRTRPEPKELQTHIGKLRNTAPPPTAPTTKPAGGFKTKAEKDKYILARQMLDASGGEHFQTPEEWQ